MTEASGISPFDAFFDFARAWMPTGIAAPQQLSQSILPGWSLISVNEGNSAAPDTEQAIVAKASYGRQLGRLLDAVEALIAERPEFAGKKDAFAALHALAEEVNAAKRDAAKARINRLRSDLVLLEEHEPAEFARQKAALLALLGER